MLKRQRICQLGTKNRPFKIYLMKTRVIIWHSFASQVNLSCFMDIQHTGFYGQVNLISDTRRTIKRCAEEYLVYFLLPLSCIFWISKISCHKPFNLCPKTVLVLWTQSEWNWMQNLINLHWKSTNNNSVRGQTFDLLLLSQMHTFRKQMQLSTSKIMRNVPWLCFWRRWKHFALKLAMQRVCCILLTKVTNVS